MKALSSVTRPFGHVCLDWMREENQNNLESALRSPFQAWIRVYRISVFEMKHWNLCGLLTILRPPSLMKYWLFLQSRLKLSLSFFFSPWKFFWSHFPRLGLMSHPSVPFRLFTTPITKFSHFIVIVYGTRLCFTLKCKKHKRKLYFCSLIVFAAPRFLVDI